LRPFDPDADQVALFAAILLCSSDEKGPATNSHSTVTEVVVPTTDSPAWWVDPVPGLSSVQQVRFTTNSVFPDWSGRETVTQSPVRGTPGISKTSL